MLLNAIAHPVPRTADIPARVQSILDAAIAACASDVHIEPLAAGCEVRFRIDGLLQCRETVSADIGQALIARLMVLAHLLTYRRDVPQEGRANIALGAERTIDLRISVMPTTHGLRAAVRLPAELTQPKSLGDLDLNPTATQLINDFVAADAGVLVIIGPAGSGKTTTAYAVLQAIQAAQPGVSIVALEDPVERDLPGITQIQVEPFGQLTYATALRSILRQDPQVLMLGEIRDAATASIAMQAGLSGHRLVCTLHAADAAGAISRLLEMQLEPYQISSSLFGVISQRLLRRKSAAGYHGRMPISEVVRMDDPLRRLIASQLSADALRDAYRAQPGFVSLHQSAAERIVQGATDEGEMHRVLGIRTA